jgi:hypothetical protein
LRLLAPIKKRGFGSGKAQTAAIPGGIARIGNTARAEKTLFYVPDRVKHCTRFKDDLQHPRVSVVVRIGMGRKASFCSQ